ncbi:response regulator transcription factor [bacterium]|nr:response regulator transcription factor [bacterium]
MQFVRLLIVDDEIDFFRTIQVILEENLFVVSYAKDTKEALEKIKQAKPDLILLDIRMPGMDGFQFCRNLKSEITTANIPLIFLSNKRAEFDKVLGLELGAEDFITKSTRERELLARIKTVLRRKKGIVENNDFILTYKKLSINLDRRKILLHNKKIYLTPKEFDLLVLFIKKRGRVLNRTFLVENVWGYEYFKSSRTIDTHVKQLRKKLGAYGKKIVTLKGVGYVFEEDE